MAIGMANSYIATAINGVMINFGLYLYGHEKSYNIASL